MSDPIDAVSVSPAPSEEEMAAILAAYEALWPRPSGATEPDALPRWRFAGRWWSARPRYGGWT
ncbi:MAG: hypothetical protein R8F63_18325 [Acidimicrobiales bacterium]|nr:hypothetical protein [Acidimicrobiales bacterium]